MLVGLYVFGMFSVWDRTIDGNLVTYCSWVIIAVCTFESNIYMEFYIVLEIKQNNSLFIIINSNAIRYEIIALLYY